MGPAHSALQSHCKIVLCSSRDPDSLKSLRGPFPCQILNPAFHQKLAPTELTHCSVFTTSVGLVIAQLHGLAEHTHHWNR